MSTYARPASLDEALALLSEDGGAPFGGGTDLAGQVDRGIRSPTVLVDLRGAGLGTIEEVDDGLRVGATVTLAELAASPLVAAYTAVGRAASLAASPLLRNVGTVGGNLCQHTRCWYYRGAEWHCWLGGGETCYAQIGDHRRHNLEPGDCISAHPSDLAPAFAASGAVVEIRSASGAREHPLLELYRTPTADNRSLLTLEPGEVVVAVRLPDPPDAAAYERLGERAAFSFPLVSVAAARRGSETRLVAAGVANVPRELDPDEPLAGLPGNPQTGWKLRALEALVQRALAALG
ncbi:MAG TPA: FAD binding domain-containing protein [Gaiella sp.]|jgi:xanthine dehydrogenase YagS FAD-binding subunit